jgi:hypothetical protein
MMRMKKKEMMTMMVMVVGLISTHQVNLVIG